MTYKETLDWLFNQLPVYQNQGKSAYKADLSNITQLSNYLGDPHKQFKSIHVAGTNGKGSSSHMLAAVLQQAGYKVGLYTSPHLKDFRERIKINGENIPEQNVVNFVGHHKRCFEELQLSFFEMTVGMAFDYFAKEKVDIAVIEVGLGGRLDATNIVKPEISLITNIGLDHTNLLGNSLKKIAGEKAGIIKKKVPVVVSETQDDITHVFRECAMENHSAICFADKEGYQTYKTDLLGWYQQKNINGVLAVLERLKGFQIEEQHKIDGLQRVVDHTGLLGRWQVLTEAPMTICDTAHNVEGLTSTMRQLEALSYDKKHVVFGMVRDKNIDEILDILPKNACYYFCAPNNSRALPIPELCEAAKARDLIGLGYSSVKEAVIAARDYAEKNDVIYIGGSTFVVAEIL